VDSRKNLLLLLPPPGLGWFSVAQTKIVEFLIAKCFKDEVSYRKFLSRRHATSFCYTLQHLISVFLAVYTKFSAIFLLMLMHREEHDACETPTNYCPIYILCMAGI
jgi:hypothetical protein